MSIIRHQVGSLAATAVDFGVMMVAVSLVGLAPATGTAIGATFGGVSNFILGRRWIFQSEHGDASGQAFRYALVSLVSLALNTAGEHALVAGAHLQFVAARVVVAFVVSLLWNFPMQRSFVFRSSASLVRVTS